RVRQQRGQLLLLAQNDAKATCDPQDSDQRSRDYPNCGNHQPVAELHAGSIEPISSSFTCAMETIFDDRLGASEDVWPAQTRTEQQRRARTLGPSLRVAARTGVRCVARLVNSPRIDCTSRLAAIPFWPQRIARPMMR